MDITCNILFQLLTTTVWLLMASIYFSPPSGGPCTGVSSSILIVMYITLSSWRPGDATACPYNHFESCVEGTMTKQETIVRTIAQVIGGVAVFRLIQVLWGIEIAETHVGRSHSAIYNVCTADLAGEGDDIIYSLNLQILLLYLSNNTMIIDYI